MFGHAPPPPTPFALQIAGVSGRNLALASASPGEYRCVSSSGGAALATVEEPLFGADRVELVTAASVSRLVWAMSSARVKVGFVFVCSDLIP